MRSSAADVPGRTIIPPKQTLDGAPSRCTMPPRTRIEEVAMRSLLSLIVALTVVSPVLSQTTPPPAITVIRVGVLIDGKSDQHRREQVIVIRGSRIESVSDAPTAKLPAGASTHDA